jgi:hypothetical protein
LSDRWNYFANNLSTIPNSISLIESVPYCSLCDIPFLENELIPALGLNDECLNEQPPELARHFGKGLFVFQYPNQLARYLAWLSVNATKISSYAEIGSRWGGTFIVVCEWLRRIGAPLKYAIAIDPIGETPFLASYGNHLRENKINYIFAQDYSTSRAVRDLLQIIGPDFVFIDGDHSMRGALADHMLARKCAKILVHHDVSSDSCPETTALWAALKDLESTNFTSYEFTDQYASVLGSFLGIGALIKH